MSRTLAPRVLFAANSLLARGDDHVADGWHIHLRWHEALGLPLHPFVAVPLSGVDNSHKLLYDADSGMVVALPINLANTQGIFIDDGHTPQDPRLVVIEFTIDAHSRMQIRVAERGHPERVIAQRTFADPQVAVSWRIAVPGRVQILLRGSGAITDIRTLRLFSELDKIFKDGQGDAVTFGLPIDGDHRWYAGGEGLARAMDRVEDGAPKRLSPIDLPDGSVVATDRARERTRVEKVYDPIMTAVKVAVDDQDFDPQKRLWSEGASDTGMRFAAPAALATFAGDPGLARLLGFAYPAVRDILPNTAWLIGALFAFDPNKAVRPFTCLKDFLIPLSLEQTKLRDYLFDRYRHAGEIAQSLAEQHLEVVPLVTVATSTELDDPQSPKASPGRSEWHVMTSRLVNPDAPSQTVWRQTIQLISEARLGMIGLARQEGGTLLSLNREIAGLAGRRVPLFASSRQNLTGADPEYFGAVADLTVPESAGDATWSISVADEFGRWAKPVTLACQAPARPRPPVPSPEVTFLRGDDDSLPQGGAVSPGTIRIGVTVPPLSSLLPGALRIETVEVEVEGMALQSVPVPADDTLPPFIFAAPPLGVGETIVLTWSVRFRDVLPPATPDEALARGSITLKDGRRPEPIKTSRTLVWTGRRDPTGQAEVALKWPARAVAYNLYLSSEESFADLIGGTPAFKAQPRAARATAIYDFLDQRGQVVPPPDDRSRFTRLNGAPIKVAGEAADHRFTFAGAASVVHLIRLVPVSATGVEAAFAGCGIIPLAVPTDAVPAPPTVIARSTTAGVEVEVNVGGIPATLFEQLQQGTGEGFLGLECRLRRGLNRSTEPLYMREINRMMMQPIAGEAGRWTATFLDGGADGPPPFVPLLYVAEVRLPPELATIRDAVVLPLGTGVEPIFGTLGASMDCPWSSASVAVSTTLVPEAPPTLDGITLTDEPGDLLRVTVPSLPVAHPKALRPYVLSVWPEAESGKKGVRVDTTISAATVTVDLAASAEIRGIVAVVTDPLGRLGAVARMART